MRLGNDLLEVGRSRCRAFGRIAWQYGYEDPQALWVTVEYYLLSFTTEPDLDNVYSLKIRNSPGNEKVQRVLG